MCEMPGTSVSTNKHVITIVNNSLQDIWIGSQANTGFIPPTYGVPGVGSGGWEMKRGDPPAILYVDRGWAGRFWARTNCTFDNSGNGSCLTGNCASPGTLYCGSGGGRIGRPPNGWGAQGPVTLAEFKFDGAGNQDFFDISQVNGYNISVKITPDGSTGARCSEAGCPGDTNTICPGPLQLKDPNGNVIGCYSACDWCVRNPSKCSSSDADKYCCRAPTYNCSPYSTKCSNPNQIPCDPAKVWPVDYTTTFTRSCPDAYSFQFNDPTSTFQCDSTDPGTGQPSAYTVTFFDGNDVSSSTQQSVPKILTTAVTPPLQEISGSFLPTPAPIENFGEYFTVNQGDGRCCGVASSMQSNMEIIWIIIIIAAVVFFCRAMRK